MTNSEIRKFLSERSEFVSDTDTQVGNTSRIERSPLWRS